MYILTHGLSETFKRTSRRELKETNHPFVGDTVVPGKVHEIIVFYYWYTFFFLMSHLSDKGRNLYRGIEIAKMNSQTGNPYYNGSTHTYN
jgi:hypothetical protein